MNSYAGIGSRDTPEEMLTFIEHVARGLSASRWMLNSGGAEGADTAFEKGAGSRKRIFVAEDATDEATELSGRFHPAWDRCSPYVRNLMARNAMIILGEDLKTPVDFVLCWSLNLNYGGTSQGARIAAFHSIPVWNLNDKHTFRKVATCLSMLKFNSLKRC